MFVSYWWESFDCFDSYLSYGDNMLINREIVNEFVCYLANWISSSKIVSKCYPNLTNILEGTLPKISLNLFNAFSYTLNSLFLTSLLFYGFLSSVNLLRRWLIYSPTYISCSSLLTLYSLLLSIKTNFLLFFLSYSYILYFLFNTYLLLLIYTYKANKTAKIS